MENHSPSPVIHNRHTNHDRRDPYHDVKHSQSDQKPYDRDGKPEHHRDVHPDRRKDPHASHSERKPQSSHHSQDPKLIRKDDRRDPHSSSQPQRKDAQHSSEQRERERSSHHDNHKRDLVDGKKESDINGRPHSGSSSSHQARTHPDLIKQEVNRDSPTARVDNQGGSLSQSSTPGGTSESSRKLKPETSAINIHEYMKRKKEKELQMEKEKKEKDILEKERREKEMAIDKERREKYEKEKAMKIELERQKERSRKKAEAELMNKTFSEGSNKEQKHRPPKLDISLPLPEQKHVNNRERPYEVNIKSPIKPHHNITVKSPIKSSDLKQPKLELPKVQITPEKDGSDPFSVNINSDPAIRRLINVNVKQEPGLSDDNETESGTLTHVKSKQNISSASETSVSKSSVEPKHELEPGEIDEEEPEINLLPEHGAAPNVKIRELGYDPDKGLDSAVALKHAMKEQGSGRSTPVSSQAGSGSNTPIRMKLPITSHGESSPLKIKISTKGLSTDSDHSSGKQGSPHRRKHKHKEKHKSHKHKDRHKEKHREKHGSSSSSSATGTNGQSLKISLKLSDINKHSSSSNDSWAVKQKQDKHKNRATVSDPSLIKSLNSSEPERQQPWSMSALITKSGSETAGHNSPSRKRRRTPTVDQSAEQQGSQNKQQKMGSHRLRRSSSSHSVVSMEMSDGEDGQTNGPHIQTGQETQPQLSQLHESLHQLISQTQRKVESLKHSQATIKEPRPPKQPRGVDRQQSGFDLEGMMWAGNTSDLPPLPEHAPPPPPPNQLAPPPPPH